MPAEGYHNIAGKKMTTKKTLAVCFNSAEKKKDFCFYHPLYLAKVRVYLFHRLPECWVDPAIVSVNTELHINWRSKALHQTMEV